MYDIITELLNISRENKASDLHITTNSKPKARLNGELASIAKYPVMRPEDTEKMVYSVMTDKQIEVLQKNGEVDFAYEDLDGGRFRVNVYKQRGKVSAVFRILPTKILTLDELDSPPAVRSFSELRKGLVLVTGPTGSGKSTTLAAIINQINRTRFNHIITIEDPIEYVHSNLNSIVNQREVGSDTKSFNSALRASLREDPDVILVGEMRDYETISVALTAAETGHLVFSTLHTIGAASTINRIIDSFPSEARGQVRSQLSTVLEGVVTQRLVPKADKSGRIAAFEILKANDAIRNMIREDKTHQIDSAMQTSASAGMQSLDLSLAKLVAKGIISENEAVNNCINFDTYKRYMAGL